MMSRGVCGVDKFADKKNETFPLRRRQGIIRSTTNCPDCSRFPQIVADLTCIANSTVLFCRVERSELFVTPYDSVVISTKLMYTNITMTKSSNSVIGKCAVCLQLVASLSEFCQQLATVRWKWGRIAAYCSVVSNFEYIDRQACMSYHAPLKSSPFRGRSGLPFNR